MCVLSINVPIRKQYGKLFNVPRNYALIVPVRHAFSYKHAYDVSCLCEKRERERKEKLRR